jgi:hypothetical protein
VWCRPFHATHRMCRHSVGTPGRLRHYQCIAGPLSRPRALSIQCRGATACRASNCTAQYAGIKPRLAGLPWHCGGRAPLGHRLPNFASPAKAGRRGGQLHRRHHRFKLSYTVNYVTEPRGGSVPICSSRALSAHSTGFSQPHQLHHKEATGPRRHSGEVNAGDGSSTRPNQSAHSIPRRQHGKVPAW